jgi:hypothetical protein
MKIFLMLITLAFITFVFGCAPIQVGPYLYPTSVAPGAKVVKKDCCGLAGPSELIVLKGPKGVRYMAVMRRSSAGIDGRLAIDAPRGLNIELTSRRVLVEDVDTSRRFSVEIGSGKLFHHQVKPLGVPTCPNIGMDGTLVSAGSIPDRFSGDGKHGSRMLMDIRLPEAPTGEFIITAPGILVDGLPFIPSPIEFRDVDRDWEIYPMNC